MSTFSWMDYSEKERQKALDVLDLFRKEDARDELGLGSVRDAYADLLFPGTSTIMTRARYLLFVPWIYRELEEKRTSSAAIAEAARRAEVRLIDVLDSSADNEGTIGVLRREKLKRLPSSVYWQGLGSLGIRVFEGAQGEYHRSLDGLLRRRQVDDESDVVSTSVQAWHADLPEPPDGFPKAVSFRLLPEEAEYLRERVQSKHPDSFFAFLLTHSKLAELDGVDDAWDHARAGVAPKHNVEELHHARCFAEAIHGAQLLYNLMLAHRLENNPDLVAGYETRMAEWVQHVTAREDVLRQWTVARFWEVARAPLPPATKTFIEAWLQLVLPGGYKTVATNKEAMSLIRTREAYLKSPAKRRLESRDALNRWSGEAGAGRLSYRWRVARTMVRDILSAGEVPNA
jgi:hypothetical protein